MEKPAVVFSEQGFKMFLDFVKGMQEEQPKENPVDNLVKEYFKRSDRPAIIPEVEGGDENNDEIQVKHNMDVVAQVVFDYLHDMGDTATTTDIQLALSRHDIEYPLRSIAPVMKGVMNRMPGIVRVDAGVYRYAPEVFDNE